MSALSAAAEAPSTELETATENLSVADTQGRGWEEIAAAKREEVNSRIPSEWLVPVDLLPPPSQTRVADFVATSGFFKDSEVEITASSATDITAKIAAGTWTAEQVTRAFSKSAAVAHQLVCLSKPSPRTYLANVIPID
jgi:hypothetical protein